MRFHEQEQKDKKAAEKKEAEEAAKEKAKAMKEAEENQKRLAQAEKEEEEATMPKPVKAKEAPVSASPYAKAIEDTETTSQASLEQARLKSAAAQKSIAETEELGEISKVAALP